MKLFRNCIKKNIVIKCIQKISHSHNICNILTIQAAVFNNVNIFCRFIFIIFENILCIDIFHNYCVKYKFTQYINNT